MIKVRIYNQLEERWVENEFKDNKSLGVFLWTMVFKDYYEVFVLKNDNVKYYVNNRKDWSKLLDIYNPRI